MNVNNSVAVVQRMTKQQLPTLGMKMMNSVAVVPMMTKPEKMP